MSKQQKSIANCQSEADANGFHVLRIAQRLAETGLRGVVTMQGARTVLRLGFSASAAIIVGQLVMNQSFAPWLIAVGLVLLVAAALTGFVGDRLQAATEAGIAIRLRDAATDRLNVMPASQLRGLSAGTLIVSMQRYPEALASLVIGHRAASIMMGIGPMAAAAALLPVSWEAAVLIIALTPIMIAFFALVGDAIRRRAVAQEQAFGRLAGQFADRIRTLPTILANQALAKEQDKLAGRLETYARKTMGVLGIAFINAGIIDFFASLSIAVLAILLGLGHLKLMMIPGFSHLELWQSLFILMIAPDYFAPFRRFSEQYHAKAEGLAAAAALDGLLDIELAPSHTSAVSDLRHQRLPARGLVAVVGPSGCGKSTLLRRLAVVEDKDEANAGARSLGDIVWVSTDCLVPEGTLADAIGWKLAPTSMETIADAAGAVGLLDDVLLPGGLGAWLVHGGGYLSGGQRLRISVARAIVSGRTVIADEPTAKLDAATASLVRQALMDMSRTRLVVVATHDRKLATAARDIIDLAPGHMIEVAV